MAGLKKIVITGVSGFIGFNLARYLGTDYEIIGIDKEPWKDSACYKFYQQDINDPLPNIKDVYAVIHLAAKAGVRESQDNFEQYVKDNILGTKNLLDKCKDWKPKLILLASSSSVYGDSKEPSHEIDKLHPKSLYAASKVAMEEIGSSYSESILDCPITSLRFFTVYGPNQRKGLAIRNFIDNILREVPITIYGDGFQRRDFTYIDDLCYMIECLLVNPEKLNNIKTLNLGYGITHSLYDIIYTTSKLTGKVVRMKYEPKDPHDVYKTETDPSLLSFLIELNEPVSLEEGLKKQIEWSKKWN